MALAKFLDKAALNASQVLQNYDRTRFEEVLLGHTIGIAISPEIKNQSEGEMCADLLIRLIARLYPNITFIREHKKQDKLISELTNLAVQINPEINIETKRKHTIAIVLGNCNIELENVPTFYLGSNGWVSTFSKFKHQTFGNSNNPFGAGAAACFGAANIFREVFKEQLPYGKTDDDFTFSIIDYKKDPEVLTNPTIDNIDLDETLLVGVGAIGNSTVWALSKIDSLTGKIYLIDDQALDLSNLQRYSLSVFNDVTRSKVEIAKDFFNTSKISVVPFPNKWNIFCAQRNDWNINRVAACVDSAVDRIAVQSSLPKIIFNAWTQFENLGISRHYNFESDVCLACLYLPDNEIPNFYQEVAKSLKIPESVALDYLAFNKPVDIELLELVCKENKIEKDLLIPYIGENIEIFYSGVICSGTFLSLTGETEKNQNVEVPCAFESALAGILLAAEIVIDAGKLRNEPIYPISSFNLLRPTTKYILNRRSKHHSGNCICQDAVYQNVYKKKYGSEYVASGNRGL